MNYLLPLLVFLPMLAALVSYLIGRRSKPARNAFVCVLLTAECLLAAWTLYRAYLGEEIAFTWTASARCTAWWRPSCG